MTRKVLYIDDEINGGRAQIDAIKDALEANGLLSVVLCEVDKLEIIISKIKNEKAQAVILDLQLDEAANSKGERASFKATTTEPHMIGQMQVINVINLYEAKLKIYEKSLSKISLLIFR